MPRRSSLGLSEIAAWDNLTHACWRAAKGKRTHPAVIAFTAALEPELERLRKQILAAELPDTAMQVFEIRDPKPRIIHAPCFRQRVLHHALMAKMGPILERSLVADTFACIVGRGTHAAIRRARAHARRHAWYAKIDISAYFASIDHERMHADLQRRFKDPGLLRLCWRILAQHHTAPGRGLPIGALTSQHFANLYLAPLDRFLLEHLRVAGMVRYMDDVAWWGRDRARVRHQLDEVGEFLAHERGLSVKPNWQLNRSEHGIPLCGVSVTPHAIRPSLRRKRRYRASRARWEAAFRAGRIDALALQRGHDAALAILAHTSCRAWLRAELSRRPALDA